MPDKIAPVKVMMLGLRGFPDVQGGVEKHAEQLCTRLVNLGCQVEVVVRSPSQPVENGKFWRGIKFTRIWAPKSSGLEAVAHTFLGVLYAAIKRPDILHIQAIGPALFAPLARLFGLNVVVTHHGPDYDREKWGRFARSVLRLGEYCGMRFSHRSIAISNVIRELVREKHQVKCDLIHNGVVIPEIPRTARTLAEFGLEPGRYILMVSRLVEEKRHLDLIEAFSRAQLHGWKLAIVGGSDHPDDYEQKVISTAAKVPGVVLTGFQKGQKLQELFAHAGLFVLPSTHEGLPIAMLEALSYGLPVVASNIPANVEVGLDAESYFPVGDVGALAIAIQQHARPMEDVTDRAFVRHWVGEKYDWHRIAEQTIRVYRSIVSPQHVTPLFNDAASPGLSDQAITMQAFSYGFSDGVVAGGYRAEDAPGMGVVLRKPSTAVAERVA